LLPIVTVDRSGGFPSLSGGALLMGAITALGFALCSYLLLGDLGLVTSEGGRGILVFVQYVSQLLAGYVAGRLAPAWRLFHGGVSALCLLVVTVAISVARDPVGAFPLFVLLGVVAMVIGAAGGALAEWRIVDRDEGA
jgi:hypothetical protein